MICFLKKFSQENVPENNKLTNGVIVPRFWAARYTVISITKRWYFLAAIQYAQIVESLKQVIEYLNELFGGFLRGHFRKSNDISEQNADVIHAGHVKRSEQALDIASGSEHGLVAAAALFQQHISHPRRHHTVYHFLFELRN